ncbi:unnamed protein product [Ilex paraguariensis]|uniref:Uncharacterized protein n=1 Tax=Ilex paraguariensis TaxID=185542 RepID=A0ABC8TFE8_9AQUA
MNNVEDFFARVTGQIKRAQSLSSAMGGSSCTNIKSAAVRKSSPSVDVLAKAKEDVEKLLVMPFQDVLLLENHSTLSAALSVYAASPNLTIGRALALEKLKRSLPSLSSTFQRAKDDQEKYYKKAAKKVVLIDELAKGRDTYTNLRNQLEKLAGTIGSIKDQIKELKVSQKEAKIKKKAIEEQEVALAKACFTKSAVLENMEAEFPALEQMKELADSDIAQVEASWAGFKSKILDTEQ